jgi:monoamine oxidase
MTASNARHVGYFDVCIIGVGLSGVFAAHLLGLGGKSVAILDARRRVGGRLLMAGGVQGSGSGNLGGAWIWPRSKYAMVKITRRLHIKILGNASRWGNYGVYARRQATCPTVNLAGWLAWSKNCYKMSKTHICQFIWE